MKDPITYASQTPGNSAELVARQTVIKDLPVAQIAKRALAMPFKHLTPLVRMGGISFILSVILQISANLLKGGGGWASMALLLVIIALAIVYIPFEVGWTRLVLDGPSAVADRPVFQMGRIEWRYLITVLLFGLPWLLIFVPIFVIYYAYLNFEHHLVIEATVVMLWLFIAIAVCVIRAILIFPAIATDNYKGFAASWRQTKGSFETLAVLETLVRLPYALVLTLLARLVVPYSPTALKVGVAGFQSLLYVFSNATVVGALALAYRHLATQNRQDRPT
jgi:hypothetical protein